MFNGLAFAVDAATPDAGAIFKRPTRNRTNHETTETQIPGDVAIEKLMARYDCPTGFHIARMRALGEIVSLKTAPPNPVDVIKSYWGDDFPNFKHEAEATEFFNNMLAHWNHMARGLAGTRVKLSRTGHIKTWDDVAATLRQRAAEIRDGFVAGFTTDQAIGSYPDALNDAITDLKILADQFDQTAGQIEADKTSRDQLDINDAKRMISEGSSQVEMLLDVLCTVRSRAGIGLPVSMPSIGMPRRSGCPAWWCAAARNSVRSWR